jgi:DNA (cytosine-5)-methyltransferase 1
VCAVPLAGAAAPLRCAPRRYPATDILITSPECTNHSLAKGKARKWQQQADMFGRFTVDPAEERSRATMWDVCRFAEAKKYKIVIVENVVEARHWAPFQSWLDAMDSLGYNHETVYFNSMFAWPTPQSRDRMYVVFWRKTLRKPDLRITPLAHCPQCGRNVDAVQSWKNPQKKWGKYQQQYVYRCPNCATEVIPYYFCAANAIDWTLPAPRIGDRARPLKEKTLKRIRVGLEKFGRQPVVMDYVHTARNDRDQDMVWTTERPHRTQLGIHTQALVTPPFLVSLNHSDIDRTRSIEGPMATAMPYATPGLVVPPFLVQTSHPFDPREVKSYPIDDAVPTQTGRAELGIVMPFLAKLRGDESADALDRSLSTITAGGVHHGLVVPPAFLTSYNSTSTGSDVAEPVPTQDTRDRHGLVVPPFIVSYYTRLGGREEAVSGIDAPAPTVPGWAVHYLAQPGETPAVEDCGFRMLQPHEIKSAMAFGRYYKVLGTQRQQVKQLGNAVTPPVMKLLVKRCIAILH